MDAYRYRLHDTTGDDLGILLHPAPNVEPGDVVMLADGRQALVTCRVEAEGARLRRSWRSRWHRASRPCTTLDHRLKAGMNLVEVAARLGHSPTTTLSTYAHVLDGFVGQPPIDLEEEITKARGSTPSERLART